MKRLLGCLICLTALAAPLAAWAEPALTIANPRLVLEKPVPQGELIEAVFEIANTGDSELSISKVATG